MYSMEFFVSKKCESNCSGVLYFVFFISMKYCVTKSPLASMIKCVNERCEDTYISRVGFLWFFFQEKVLMFFTLKFDFSPFVFCFLFEFIQIHLVIRR